MVSLTLVLLAFLGLSPWLERPRNASAQAGPSVAVIRDRLHAGQRALAEGKFRLARKTFNAAICERDRNPELLSPTEHRQLNRWQRQSDLLARLSSHSLEEILRSASLVRDPEEWQAQFNDHKGKTVLFDDVVGRDASGRAALQGYEVWVRDERAHVALEEVALLRDLPLTPPRRLLFGARLAWCGRGEGGRWVVRFEPDSGVLLTDLGAARACSAVPLDELGEVIEWQQKQAEQLAAVRPAQP